MTNTETWLAEELAPAKINLYLHVVGKTTANFHLLDSLVVFADAADRLKIAPSDQLSLSVDGPFGASLSLGKYNLVWKAAQMFASAFGRRVNFRFHLEKNLPIASGIGGGSSNAAACLRLLCKQWNISPNDMLVKDIALSLGADVPVCLNGQAVFFGGIGEILEPAPLIDPIPLLLVNPGFSVMTKDVFAARFGPFTKAVRDVYPPTKVDALAAWLAQRSNDLAVPACGLNTIIGEVLKTIGDAEGCRFARMSGSGATCFGLFSSQEAVEAAALKIKQQNQVWWVHAGHTVSDIRSLAA